MDGLDALAVSDYLGKVWFCKGLALLNRKFLLVLTLLATFAAARALDNPRDRLDRLRGELDSLSTVLRHYTRSEQDLGSRISATDQQIATRQQLIRELEQQRIKEQRAVVHFDTRIGEANARLNVVRERLGTTRKEVKELEDLVAARAVYLYVNGSRRTLRFLAAAENPGDLIRRRIYVQKLADRDAKNLRELRDARNRQMAGEHELEQTLSDLQTSRKRKQESVNRVDRLVRETQNERARVQQNRRDLQTLLASAQRSRKAVEELISDREEALKQVEDWIASLESRRTTSGVQEISVGPRQGDVVIRDVRSFASFSKAKGKLPWPIRGRVISQFGLHKNTVTGTLTENPGVDIRANAGEEVIAVQSGICKRITFLRGFGTTILVEHGDGYYTVYAHMGEVWIGEGETVEAGRVLGTVAATNSTGDTSLHFQVWHKRVKQNPLEWLSS
ncbi:MAG: peptidoglycan DD-metalloendopeptidase family protein [bacterium]